MNVTKLIAIAVAVTCVALASGCGGFRLHNEIREKQGTTAKEAWAKVDLSGLVKAERENLKKLLDLELETQDQLAREIRNQRLRSLVEGKVGEALIKPTNELLNQLVGSADKFEKTKGKVGELRSNVRKLESRREAFEGLPFSAPSCDEIKDGNVPAIEAAIVGLSAGRQAAYRFLVQELDAACKAVKPGEDAEADTINAYRGLGGEMVPAIRQYEADQSALEAILGKDAPLKLAYKVARDEYDQALAKYERDSKLFDKVQEKAAELSKAAAGLAELQDAFSIQLLSEGRLKSIDTFFKTVSSTDPASNDAKEGNSAAVALALLPDLVDKSRAALAEANKPLAFPLLMRRNYEQLRLQAATREIAARKAMVALSRELMDWIYLEAGQVAHAAQSFRDAKVAESSGEAVLVAFADKNKREQLYNGAARYLHAIDRLEARRYKLQYLRIAATHELALAYSEVNLKQWESLIGTTVYQVADYSAGGIKSQDITDLINAAVLSYIGVGVNQ